jgi:predicted nucleic acid-binding protein
LLDSEVSGMLVVSDTSPITNLAAVGHLDLLQALYTKITVPNEVRDELVLGGAGNNPGAREVLSEPWFEVMDVEAQARSQLARAYPALDIGEVAALALAVERSADLVLLDDQAARRAASALKLSYIGVVGILLAAKARGLAPRIKPILDDLVPARVSAWRRRSTRKRCDMLASN